MQSGSVRPAPASWLAATLLTLLPVAAAAAPVFVSLDANKALVRQGERVQLSWATSGAVRCTAEDPSGEWQGAQPSEGAVRVRVEALTTFRLTCDSADTSASRSVSVDVLPQSRAEDGAPDLILAVSKRMITPGEQVRLQWDAAGATACSAGGDGWRGDRPVRGTHKYNPDRTAAYTLTCENVHGRTTRRVEVEVVASIPEPAAEPQPEVEESPVQKGGPALMLTATSYAITPGETVRLHWDAATATTCTAAGGWRGVKPIRGTYIFRPQQSVSYSMTCENAQGRTQRQVDVQVAAANPEPAPPPVAEPESEPQPVPDAGPQVSLTATSHAIAPGETVRLHWDAATATTCSAGGAWRGVKPIRGTYRFRPLQPVTYEITCANAQGSTTRSVDVMVTAVTPEPEPAPDTDPAEEPVVSEPSVDLAASSAVVEPGGYADLQWRASDADACSAAGAWKGQKPTRGSERVGPIEQQTTFSLSCSGAGGNAMAMISVSVNDQVELSWQAPDRKLDGSALDDLAGYRIYYGHQSGSYSDSILIREPGARRHSLALPSGSYYFALTALDSEGNESPFSNEIIQNVL